MDATPASQSEMTDTPLRKRGRPSSSEGTPTKARSRGTLFGHAASLIGMTHAELADHLGLSLQSVRYYASGYRPAPDDVLAKVSTLWEQVSFRTPPTHPLPAPAAERRKAIQSLRIRDWYPKDHTPDDDEDDDA